MFMIVVMVVIVVMIVATWLQYRQRLREIEALEKQGITRRAASKAEGKSGK